MLRLAERSHRFKDRQQVDNIYISTYYKSADFANNDLTSITLFRQSLRFKKNIFKYTELSEHFQVCYSRFGSVYSVIILIIAQKVLMQLFGRRF
jgi:hypothetical protein